jgi:serine beta-lactamase-like protein LACTB, mitochondrial
MNGIIQTALIALMLPNAVTACTAPPARNLPPATIDSVSALLRGKMATDRIPGLSVAIVVDGALVWAGGFGYADLTRRIPADSGTVYRSASIGKSLTATAAMQLSERDSLDLDAPIQRFCPAFPEKRWPVTTRHLLTHTSGIRHYGGPRHDAEVYNTVVYGDVVTPLEIFADDSLLFEPGTRHLYSTFGYNVLGCVVQGAAGRPFMEVMRTRIFQPAEMRHTRDDDPGVRVPNRASGYVIGDGDTLQPSRAVNMTSKMPAGGYLTTAPDLARFAAALMAGRLVTPATLEHMFTPARLANGELVPYGLGWGLFPGEDWYGQREAFHGGGTPEVSGVLYLLPDAKFAVAILSNLENVPERTALAAQIARIVLAMGSNTR